MDNAERGLVHRRKSFKLLRRDAGELKRLLLGALCCFLPLLVLSHTAHKLSQCSGTRKRSFLSRFFLLTTTPNAEVY